MFAPGAPRPLAVFDHLGNELEREDLVILHLQRDGFNESAECARQKLLDVVLAREGQLERGLVDGVVDLPDRDTARELELPSRGELEDVRQCRRAAGAIERGATAGESGDRWLGLGRTCVPYLGKGPAMGRRQRSKSRNSVAVVS